MRHVSGVDSASVIRWLDAIILTHLKGPSLIPNVHVYPITSNT
jgi:hypothetical protein